MLFSSYTEDSPIIGPPKAGQLQAAAAILALPHGYETRDIQLLFVPIYWVTSRRVGLDPVLALAQMIHETGNLTSAWSQRPFRNPAGIGVTGEGGAGVVFASWAQDSIPAHVGRVLAYAISKGGGTDPQKTLIERALKYRALPDSYRGVAPTLRGLEGHWAVPGIGYATKIANIANRISAMP